MVKRNQRAVLYALEISAHQDDLHTAIDRYTYLYVDTDNYIYVYILITKILDRPLNFILEANLKLLETRKKHNIGQILFTSSSDTG